MSGGQLAAIAAIAQEALGDEHASRQAALERVEQIAVTSRVASGPEPGGGAYLTIPDLGTVLAALDTAAEYIEYRASLTCDDCTASPAELCDVHAIDIETACNYRALARVLDGESR